MSPWRKPVVVSVFALGLSVLQTLAQAGEWSGYVAAEFRGFTEDASAAVQHDRYFSLAVQPEYRHEWDQGKQIFTFIPFVRVDQYDNARTHADIRELAWIKVGQTYEWRIGVRKVFWGVTESQHLVDIINQTDLVENPDLEDKLGQPMVNLALIRKWGTVDLFILPYFRERTFPGSEGRLRTIPRVDTDQAVYESSRKENHVDAAVRWSHVIGDWDVGLSHFSGTSREPRLVAGTDNNGNAVFVPHYDLINQTGLDVQATKGNWLWKLEAIHRSGQGPSFTAATGGFEYTFYGIFGSPKDLGVLAEYLYDDRGTASPSPYQDDVFLGVRLVYNDVQSTEALIGVVADRDSDARFLFLEAGRRLKDSWKLSMEVRTFHGLPAGDPFFSFRNDDYVQVELAYYF